MSFLKIPENIRIAEIIIHKFGIRIMYWYFFITSTVGEEWIYYCILRAKVPWVLCKNRVLELVPPGTKERKKKLKNRLFANYSRSTSLIFAIIFLFLRAQ